MALRLFFCDDEKTVRSLRLVQGHQNKSIARRENGPFCIVGQVFVLSDWLEVDIAGTHFESAKRSNVLDMAQPGYLWKLFALYGRLNLIQPGCICFSDATHCAEAMKNSGDGSANGQRFMMLAGLECHTHHLLGPTSNLKMPLCGKLQQGAFNPIQQAQDNRSVQRFCQIEACLIVAGNTKNASCRRSGVKVKQNEVFGLAVLDCGVHNSQQFSDFPVFGF